MQEQKRAERRMLAAIFFFWFSVYTYPSFLSSYSTEKLMATSVTAGMIVGSYGLTQMVLRIPFGVLSDSLKKRKMFVMLGFVFSLLASFGLSAVSLFAAGDHVPGWLPAAALICRGLSGVTAATWVNFSVLYSSGYKGEEVTAAMSRIAVPQMGSQIFAMLLGAQLADHFGELYAFLLAAAAGAAGLILMLQIRDRKPVGGPMTMGGIARIARNRQLISGTVLATVYQMVVWATVQGFVQNWARDIIGLTTAELGYLSVANLLPNVILSRLSGTVLVRRFGRRVVLCSGFLLLAAACLLYPLTASLAALLAVQAIMGAGVGLVMPITMANAIETVSDENRGTAMGIYQAVYGLGMFLGPVVAGTIIERFSAEGEAVPAAGYVANFRVETAVALLGFFLALVFTGKRRERKLSPDSGEGRP